MLKQLACYHEPSSVDIASTSLMALGLQRNEKSLVDWTKGHNSACHELRNKRTLSGEDTENTIVEKSATIKFIVPSFIFSGTINMDFHSILE